MKIAWTEKGLADLVRLHEFLASVNSPAAAKVIQSLTRAVASLGQYPQIGPKIPHYEPREVRRIIVGSYEVRYEVRDGLIRVLRLWHTREHR